MPFKPNMAEVLKKLETIGRRVNLLEKEVLTIKSWLVEDTMLTPYERKIVEKSLKKIRSKEFKKLTSLEELRKRLGI